MLLILSDTDCRDLMDGHGPPPNDAPLEALDAFWTVFWSRAVAQHGEDAADDLLLIAGCLPPAWSASRVALEGRTRLAYWEAARG